MYVGITKQKSNERWRSGGNGYRKCIVFWRAIQKYGWDAFEHFIFASRLTKEEAENMEIILIDKLKTQNPEFGYNIKSGGNAPALTDEIREKISVSHLGEKNPLYGRIHTEEEKQHLREKMTGKNNPRYGIHLTEETKNKISSALKGRHLSEETKQKLSESGKGKFKGRPKPEGAGRPSIPIICIETGVVYESINEAARKNNLQRGNIRACLNGKAKTTGGFHWEKYQPFIP